VRAETWIFVIITTFFAAITPVYWFATSVNLADGGDWTGTVALVMTTLLTLMVSIYLGVHAKKMDDRPEDRADAEIADGAGELGFFPPYSWWPLWCGSALATCTFAVAMGAWWLFIIGAALGFMALAGLVFEYYRGIHAH
jgi:hypothetical protein